MTGIHKNDFGYVTYIMGVETFSLERGIAILPAFPNDSHATASSIRPKTSDKNREILVHALSAPKMVDVVYPPPSVKFLWVSMIEVYRHPKNTLTNLLSRTNNYRHTSPLNLGHISVCLV